MPLARRTRVRALRARSAGGRASVGTSPMASGMRAASRRAALALLLLALFAPGECARAAWRRACRAHATRTPRALRAAHREGATPGCRPC
jgi:hypothetical protein